MITLTKIKILTTMIPANKNYKKDIKKKKKKKIYSKR